MTAVVAGGGDPHAFGGVDLVQSLVDTLGPHGRFGTASVFDDALAVLALEAAGTPVSDDSIQWLVDAQCADGGWQYSKPASANDDEHCLSTVRPAKDFFQSDTNTTSYVIQAVDAAGGATFATDPFAFFDDDPRRAAARLGIHVGLPDHRRELDRAGDPGVRGGRHAGARRCAHGAAEAAGPRVRRLVVHVDRLAPDRSRSRVDDRRDPRSAPAAVAGACRRGRRCGDTRAGLRVARCGRDGRVRSRSRSRSCSARSRPSWPRPESPAPQPLPAARTRRWWWTRANGRRRIASRWIRRPSAART